MNLETSIQLPNTSNTFHKHAKSLTSLKYFNLKRNQSIQEILSEKFNTFKKRRTNIRLEKAMSLGEILKIDKGKNKKKRPIIESFSNASFLKKSRRSSRSILP